MDLLNPLVSIEWNDYTTLPTGMQHAHAGDKVYIGGGMTTDPEMEPFWHRGQHAGTYSLPLIQSWYSLAERYIVQVGKLKLQVSS